jgi:hypothetical protein
VKRFGRNQKRAQKKQIETLQQQLKEVREINSELDRVFSAVEAELGQYTAFSEMKTRERTELSRFMFTNYSLTPCKGIRDLRSSAVIRDAKILRARVNLEGKQLSVHVMLNDQYTWAYAFVGDYFDTQLPEAAVEEISRRLANDIGQLLKESWPLIPQTKGF